MATLTAPIALEQRPAARRRALATAMIRTGAGSFLSGLLSIGATKIVAAVAPILNRPLRNEPAPVRIMAVAAMTAATAMLRTGAGSFASGVLSIASTKIFASVAGPAGVALLATLQQTRQTAVIAATANGQAALVQGISARSGLERREYARTGLTIFAFATALIALIMFAAPQWAARLTGLGSGRAPLVRWLAVQVVLLSAFLFLTALVNALGAIGKLAALQSVSPGVAALAMVPAALALAAGRETLLPVVLAGAAAAAVVAALFVLKDYRTELRQWFGGPGRWWSREAASSFLHVSAAMLVGGLAGSAAVVAIRSRILLSQGFAAAGQFDAAWGISMNQVMLILSSMQAYYLPALARAHSAAERSSQISTVLHLAALVAAPLIVIVTVAKPVMLALFYSHEFGQAATYLRWMLVGDYLKISGWILSVPMLASADMRMYLLAELTGYGVFVASAALLNRWWPPAESAAIAFVLMYVAHTVFCAARAVTHYRYRPDRITILLWLAGLAMVSIAGLAHWDPRPLDWKSTMAWIALALGGAGCAALGLTHLERSPLNGRRD